ncbi:MAG: hypothetical protein DIZ77_16470 [endosymbiont of Seepiophila jonesi]|uniref:Pilus assembly protein PilP n=1 Tax=endosymbiont of Lamellibrachia luymesi TaxID=2200907 RepID=A0A370DXQ7_9GAMM|nr:MAG: hypothetical protein DIZ77_16470 [endosymbiont of Seepiophila jonesi]RDH89868.1 MAG: hypothetical protein DIZ79_10640 [endosymbiont of Lamellibrachia luymesi]
MRFMVFGLAVSIASLAYAGDVSDTLVFNPFNKPEVLATPLKLERKKEILAVEPEVMPKLRATLMSDAVPMVIVDKEMLGVGGDINGYRLLLVEEGQAVFEKLGKRYTLKLEGSGLESE